ncbi:carbohydrate-binding protein [Pestalotiopsis sp. NC0098]|nr:carbohydrate-binding protein [Pestalotiopsis sp. NC0098]
MSIKPTAVLAVDACLSAVSWSNDRVDLFAVTPDAYIAHKFWTGHDWQPNDGLERLRARVQGCPSTVSWGEGRLDIFFVNETGKNVLHKYFGGGAWGPSWEDADDIGGEIVAISSASWGADRLDVVGKNTDGSYAHKAWTGESWFPSGLEWEDIGGNFFSNPASVSWGLGRLDIIGLDANSGSLFHKFYHDGWSTWEDLGGGPFIGNPVATSWAEGRLDFWAIDSNGELSHIYWDGHRYSDWENLGGEFTDTPKVVHWKQGRIDIVGRSLDSEIFHLKSFDGSQWQPSVTGWYDLAGPFDSEPALVSKRDSNFLYVFGEHEQDVRLQIWSGFDWQPGNTETWSLGHLSAAESDILLDDNQVVLETEL